MRQELTDRLEQEKRCNQEFRRQTDKRLDEMQAQIGHSSRASSRGSSVGSAHGSSSTRPLQLQLKGFPRGYPKDDMESVIRRFFDDYQILGFGKIRCTG